MAPQRRCDMIINCIITWMTSHCRTSSDNDLLGGLYDRYGSPVVECPAIPSLFPSSCQFLTSCFPFLISCSVPAGFHIPFSGSPAYSFVSLECWGVLRHNY